MSFEINPVLAGTFDSPNYSPPPNNIETNDTDDADTATATNNTQSAANVDSRRYTQFDRTVTDAGSTTNFTFSDLLDTINPLEHIPLVSAVYRAITGDKINPVARVAGDILYGGAFGPASAIAGGMGAIANETLAASTGKDAGGTIIAAVFGSDDKKNSVQLTSAQSEIQNVNQNATPAETQSGMQVADAGGVIGSSGATAAGAAAVVSGANASTPSLSSAAASNNAITPAPLSTPAAPAAPAPWSTNLAANTSSTPTPSGTIPLIQAKAGAQKQPFGGVMAPPSVEAQNMAMALSSASGSAGLRMGHTIYTNRFVNNSARPLSSGFAPSTAMAGNGIAGSTTLHIATSNTATALNTPSPNPAANLSAPKAAASQTAPTAPNPADADTSMANVVNALNAKAAASYGLPPNLLNDIAALKATNQYKNAASLGSNLNTTN